MLLRCTAKLLTLLRVSELVCVHASSEDWYANLLWLDRRKCLLLTHADTLFPVFVADVRAAQLRPLGPWLVATVAGQLHAERLPPDALGALDPNQVRVAKTARRYMLGVMNDMASYAEAVVDAAGGLAPCDLERLNHTLRRGLHRRGGQYVTPMDLVTAQPAR